MNPEEFGPGDPLWFWWPLTFAVAAVGAAAHIAGTARRNNAPPARLLVFAGLAVLSAAVAIIPFMIGSGATCSDTGLGLRLNLYALLAGFPALVAWVAMLWGLYVTAGGDRAYGERYPLILFFGVLAGMVLEFPFSMSSIDTYCQGSWRGARIHLVAAGLGAGIVGSLVLTLGGRVNGPAGSESSGRTRG